MSTPKVRKTGSKTVYRGRVVSLTLDSYETSTGTRFSRETFRHPPSVVILPVLPGGKVLLIRQFRHALGRYIHEIPAGTSEPGESMLACAKRELAEETCHRAARWKELVTFYPAPGVSTERMTLFRADGLSPLARRVACDKDEFIAPVPVSSTEALAMVRRNEIIDAKSIIGILFGLARIRW